MKKKRYTASLIGTGRIGFTLGFDKKREQPASHTMALLKNKRIQLIAACDSDATKLNDWKRFCPRAQTYANYGHLFAAKTSDIIVIAVNENAHLESCIAAIRAKPRLIILEKPVALSMREGLQIADEAKKNNVPILVNHERRFALDYKIAKSYLNTIGNLQSIRGELFSRMPVFSKEKKETGEYSLLHDGTHLIDIVHYFLENEKEIESEEKNFKQILFDMKIMDAHRDEKNSVRNLNVHFASEKCSDVSILINGCANYFGFGVDIIGSDGRIVIGNGYARFYKTEESKLYENFFSLSRDETIRVPQKTKYFSRMVQSAIDFLDGKILLNSSLHDALRTLDVIEQIILELESQSSQ